MEGMLYTMAVKAIADKDEEFNRAFSYLMDNCQVIGLLEAFADLIQEGLDRGVSPEVTFGVLKQFVLKVHGTVTAMMNQLAEAQLLNMPTQGMMH